MNRRNFLRLVPAAIVAGVVAPKIFIPKDGPVKPSVWGPDVEIKLKNQLSMLRKNYIIGCDPVTGNDQIAVFVERNYNGKTWLESAEWQFHKDWIKQQEQIARLYDFYRERTFLQMHL